MKAKLAYILCAGEGTRLLPLTEFTPKPLLPLLDKPMVFHVMDALCIAGVKKVVVNLHSHAQTIQKSLSLYAGRKKIKVRFLHESTMLGTGGALQNARSCLNKPFFLVNTDFLPVGFSFEQMEREHDGLATLAVRAMKSGEPYNPVGVNKQGEIVRVNSVFGSGGKDHHFLGVHRLEPESLEFLRDNGLSQNKIDCLPEAICLNKERKVSRSPNVFSIFEGLYHHMFSSRQPIKTHICKNVFSGDPGTLSGYLAAHEFLLKKSGRKKWIGPGVRGLRKAKLGSGTVLGQGVCLGEGVKVSHAVIFPRVNIPPGAVIHNAIVGSTPPGSLIGRVFINGKEAPLR